MSRRLRHGHAPMSSARVRLRHREARAVGVCGEARAVTLTLPWLSGVCLALSHVVPTRRTPVRLRGASGGCGDPCGFSQWVCCRPLRREICWPSLDRFAFAVALPPGLLVFLSRWLPCPALTPGN